MCDASVMNCVAQHVCCCCRTASASLHLDWACLLIADSTAFVMQAMWLSGLSQGLAAEDTSTLSDIRHASPLNEKTSGLTTAPAAAAHEPGMAAFSTRGQQAATTAAVDSPTAATSQVSHILSYRVM